MYEIQQPHHLEPRNPSLSVRTQCIYRGRIRSIMKAMTKTKKKTIPAVYNRTTDNLL